MKYRKIVVGKFISRPNRFIANVLIDGEIVKVHVKNTGRCKELLEEGNTVYLEDFIDNMGSRKMRYDLISVYKGKMLVNMDSQAPNKVVKEALEQGKLNLKGFSQLSLIKPETTYFDSRFDFYIEDENGNKGFIEVKGVTLEEKKICSFPDAKTERGTKHLNELIRAKENGYISFILFVIQMEGMRELRPNYEHDIVFSNTLIEASKCGVNILAYECKVGEDSLELTNKIEVNLDAN